MLKATRERTLSEIEYTKHHKSTAFSAVREHARRKSRFARIHECERCGYNKHVECCHVRAITDFPMDATVAEVNADENIIVLCPNCHWEFDHGIIDVSDIERIPDPQMLLF
jgi:predicted restriction endonuclease